MGHFAMTLQEAMEAEPGIERNVFAKYPIFDEEYRPVLNQMIKDQFWVREIGAETPSLFELFFRRKMNLIMPIMNKHYETDILAAKVDPLQTMKVKNSTNNESSNKSTGDSTTESDSDAKARNTNYTYPQSQINSNGAYADGANENISDTRAKGSAKEQSESIQAGKAAGETVGSTGQTSVLLFQHRTTFVNVNKMILDELEELFMSVYSNGDEYAKHTTLGYGNGFYGFGGIW